MTDLSQLSAAALAAELEVLATREAGLGFRSSADLLREAARRIAPATAALADVPPRWHYQHADGSPHEQLNAFAAAAVDVVAERRAAKLLADADKMFG